MIIRFADGTELSNVKYLVKDTDRHGNERVYVRRHGHKVRIHDLATVEEFMAAYRAALELRPTVDRSSPTAITPGSLRWLVQSYYGCPEYLGLHESTRAKRRGVLDAICREHGSLPFARMETRHVRTKIRDPKAATPEAANGRVKALRQVFKWAVEVGNANTNPARDVPLLRRNNPDGFHTWTREEVQQFEKRHASGTKARLALALFFYTGVRISDVVRLGPQMERDGELCFTEAKNRANKPKHREVPILPALRTELDGTSWMASATLQDPSADVGHIAAPLNIRIERAPPPSAVEQLTVEFTAFVRGVDELQLFVRDEASAARAGRQRALRAVVKEIKVKFNRSGLYHIVEVHPWSRIPERRYALIDYDP